MESEDAKETYLTPEYQEIDRRLRRGETITLEILREIFGVKQDESSAPPREPVLPVASGAQDLKTMAPERDGGRLFGGLQSEKGVAAWYYVFLCQSGSPQDAESLDSRVFDAFERLDREFADARVQVNPERFTEFRQYFGIRELPAFGVSQQAVGERDLKTMAPERDRGRLFGRLQRKKVNLVMLAAVERFIIQETEPPRVSRRPKSVRGWCHGKARKVPY